MLAGESADRLARKGCPDAAGTCVRGSTSRGPEAVRDRIAAPEEAAALVAALPTEDRALWRPLSTRAYDGARCARSDGRTWTCRPA